MFHEQIKHVNARKTSSAMLSAINAMRLLLVVTTVHGLSARLPTTHAPHHELRNAITEAAAAAEAIDHILEFCGPSAERANLMALRGRVRQCRSRLSIATELLPQLEQSGQSTVPSTSPAPTSHVFDCEFASDDAPAPLPKPVTLA